MTRNRRIRVVCRCIGLAWLLPVLFCSAPASAVSHGTAGAESSVAFPLAHDGDLRFVVDTARLYWDTKAPTVRRSLFKIKGVGGESLLSEEEAVRLHHYRDIRWIAPEKDLRVYNDLPDQISRDTFLKRLWDRIDPSSGTPVNERLIAHLRRAAYADEHFTDVRGRSGSGTDKGRIYVKYENPTDRDFSSTDHGGRTVEVWHYETTGNYDFIFRDRRGLGVFELVDSNRPGEVYNPNWKIDF